MRIHVALSMLFGVTTAVASVSPFWLVQGERGSMRRESPNVTADLAYAPDVPPRFTG